MRGVLVKSVSETARAAYMPAVRSWASAGRSLELIWGEHDTVTSRAGCQSALEVPPAIVPETTASVRITVVPGPPPHDTAGGRRSAGRPGPPPTAAGAMSTMFVNGLGLGLAS